MKKARLTILFLAVLMSCKSEDAVVQKVIVDISPNPCQGYFKVTITPNTQEYVLKLRDQMGYNVLQAETNEGFYEANVKNLSEGIYVLSLISKDTIIKKIFIRK